MALRFVDGFDHYSTPSTNLVKSSGESLTQKWTGIYHDGNNTQWFVVQTFGGRNGLGCLAFDAGQGSSSGNALFLTLDDQKTWIVGFFIKLDRYPSGDPFDLNYSFALARFCHRGADQVVLGIRQDGVLQLDLGEHQITGTLLKKGKCAITRGFWTYIELKVFLDSTNGTAEVRVDNEVEINFAGNTDNAGSGTANQLVMFGSASVASKGKFLLDDLYLCDGTGTRNNDFIGKYLYIYPSFTDATNIAHWTPSTGVDNAAMVDDTYPDSSATYNYTTTSSFRDVNYMTDVTSTLIQSASVLAVVSYINAALSNVGGGLTIQPIYGHLGTESNGSSVSLFGSWAYSRQIYELNPVTNTSFTAADVTSMQLGYRLC